MRNSNDAKLICFIGIDGSGKTTLAHLLAEEMKGKGYKCNYIYGRYKPMLTKPLVIFGKFLFLKNKNIKDYEIYSMTKKDAVRKHSLASLVYKYALLVDYASQLFFKLIIPQMLGRTIICDRYVYDTVINDIPRIDNNFKDIKKMAESIFNIAPRPNLAFHIALPEELAYSRKDDTPSVYYLKERKNIYNCFAKEYHMHTLDGTKKIEELKKEVESWVF
jgi:dTMP kinase